MWTGRLWILAVALGAVTIASGVSLVHGTDQRRQAAGLIAGSAIQQVAALSYDRLNVLLPKNGLPIAQLPPDSARRLLRPILRSILDSSHSLVRLDSLSLRVVRADSTILFGQLDPDRHIRATLIGHGPMSGLSVELALEPQQVPHALLMPLQHTQMFHNGLLLLSTLIVTALAFGSSRREAALASARGDFIAGVSHDLRMPLAQILLASETLTIRDDLESDERSTLAHSIVRESKRLIGLVENLLLFSRSGAVELHARKDPVAIDDLFTEVLDAVHLAADDAGQTVHVTAPAGLVATGERRLLRQALVNLIDNALKYGTRGQRIELGAERTSSQAMRLTVDDEGPGIPAAERERVFEPYERLFRDQSSERTGTGLGLAVVSHIALAHGGRVWLEGSARGGTRAVLELPAAAT